MIFLVIKIKCGNLHKEPESQSSNSAFYIADFYSLSKDACHMVSE